MEPWHCIFRRLDLHSLLRCKHVCTAWHRYITECTVFQIVHWVRVKWASKGMEWWGLFETYTKAEECMLGLAKENGAPLRSQWGLVPCRQIFEGEEVHILYSTPEIRWCTNRPIDPIVLQIKAFEKTIPRFHQEYCDWGKRSSCFCDEKECQCSTLCWCDQKEQIVEDMKSILNHHLLSEWKWGEGPVQEQHIERLLKKRHKGCRWWWCTCGSYDRALRECMHYMMLKNRYCTNLYSRHPFLTFRIFLNQFVKIRHFQFM